MKTTSKGLISFLHLVVVGGVALVAFVTPSLSASENPLATIATQVVEKRLAHKKDQEMSGRPLRLKIPTIGVDAEIKNVGLTPDQVLDVPELPSQVGWFAFGPRPGETGSAVLDGHSGWRYGKKAVFDDLHKLRVGDKVYVADDAGKEHIFVVRELRSYEKSAQASEIFKSGDDGVHLNIITCEGRWDAVEKSYASRLVVFTDEQTP